jgi:hypothetical protein
MVVEIEYIFQRPICGEGEGMSKLSQIRTKLSKPNEGYALIREKLNSKSQKQKIEIP